MQAQFHSSSLTISPHALERVMINNSASDASTSNPAVDLRSKPSGRSVLPDARGEAEPAARRTRSAISQMVSAAGKRFRSEISKPAILCFLAIHVLLGLTFYFAPGIDLGVSSLFYTPAKGFILGNRSSTIVLPFLPWVTIVFVSVLLLLLIGNRVAWWRNRQTISRLSSIRHILFLLLTLVLGPGLLINVILKGDSGRSRPSRIDTFGGDRQFTAAFTATGSCKSNCSFVSGDASMGYYLLAFLFVARKRRWAIALAAYTLGTAIGLVRIAQGAHFLSDVIFAGFFTFLVAWILHFLILTPEKDSPVTLAPGSASSS